MNLDSVCSTFNASMGGNKTPIIDEEYLNGSGEDWVKNYHKHLMEGNQPLEKIPSRLRRLTVQECSLLQSFPTNFFFLWKPMF